MIHGLNTYVVGNRTNPRGIIVVYSDIFGLGKSVVLTILRFLQLTFSRTTKQQDHQRRLRRKRRMARLPPRLLQRRPNGPQSRRCLDPSRRSQAIYTLKIHGYSRQHAVVLDVVVKTQARPH